MKNLILSFLITIVIVTIVGGGGYAVYENINLKIKITQQQKDIDNIKYENVTLRKQINRNNELISRYQKNNKELAYANSRLKRNNTSYTKPKTYTRKSKPRSESRQVYIKPKTTNKTYIRQSVNKPPKIYTPTKKYIKYRGYKKLVSDSTITTRSDNRLKSNAPIYALYYHRLLSTDCNLKQDMYKVVDECKGSNTLYGMNELYFKKSNVNDVKRFNEDTHMIECIYNQEHGLMHDCNVKMKDI